jgi:glutathione S-transferase
MTRRLITIGVSHYCEKARWALERARLPFREECHPPVFHVVVAKRLGGGRSTPVLVAPTGTFNDSTEILRQVDRECARDLRLYPDLGPAARRLVYYHLLDLPLIYPIMVDGVGRMERGLFRPLFPLCRRMMKKLLNINAAGAQRSRGKIDELYDEMDRLLTDERRYLVGDRFSAADLTFAALSVPLLLPPEYPFPMPPLEALPVDFQTEVARYRATGAGQFALRIYADERRILTDGIDPGGNHQPGESSIG